MQLDETQANGENILQMHKTQRNTGTLQGAYNVHVFAAHVFGSVVYIWLSLQHFFLNVTHVFSH